MQATMSTAFNSRHPHRSSEEVPHIALQRQGVIARLHGLFPANHHELQVEGDAGKGSNQRAHKDKPPSKYIKIRMITWNMHDSVPKGDLQDLLGVVSDDPAGQTEPGSLPAFPLDDSHPYHLIIVAGQECPSLSGIPMGIGAGFKLKDKDREKEKEREGLGERPQLHNRYSEQGKDEDEERARRRSRHRSLIRHRSSYRRSHEDLASASTSHELSSQDKYLNPHHQTSGWTYMLEDWFCGEAPSFPDGASSSFHTPEVGHDTGYLDENGGQLSPKAKSTGDLNARLSMRQKGPYELLAKERMMGLYLAIFVHRDVKPFVEKTSKSAVTAGLIGGRVGNKGGVGISLKIAGTSFLFVNAHLAAHEGKVHHRIANFVKIKNELAVDDFLAADDPRMLEEDLTNRFDFTFVCGDLNFRLDITRLHADWLISRREYGQALAFDQLRQVMKTNPAFSGFVEAPINFPPTFKYDVLRYKRSKKASKRISRHLSEIGQTHEKQLTEIEEKTQEHLQDDSDDEPEADGEAVSLASTAWTSNSRYTTDGEDPETDAEDYFVNPLTRTNANTSNLVNDAKMLSSVAAHKAKAKWMSLITKPNSPFRKLQNVKQVLGQSRPQTPLSPSYRPQSPLLQPPHPPQFVAVTSPPTPDEKISGVVDTKLDDNYLKPSRSTGSSEHAPSPTPSGNPASMQTSHSNERSDEEEEKAVYDTSYKQRVPSWCDRILWKSNLEPDSDSEIEDEDAAAASIPHRSRMGTFLHALRPASIRARKDSLASVDTSIPTVRPLQESTPSSPSSFTGETAIDYPDLLNSSHSSPPHITHFLQHSKSTDFLHARDRPYTHRTRTQLQTFDELFPRSRRVSLNSFAGQSIPPQTLYRPPSHSQPQAYESSIPPPVPPKDFLPSPTPVTSLWKSLLPFLSQNTPPEFPPTPETSPHPQPKKGDVVCLGYDTLDDRQMRRLEGRSDHRPVIGSYALYV
ncbi:Endonuclease/exonuclease/phosphatase [Irpex rosettiformis]|uniref:Endonuclease/exonuclease/phosphatase n=1 Tax=Irpex rosettiformis TaxID=378272 RepID=A0ACB8U7J7_9APHY|nr:Endonuclease/exonuclease/phosphatase [Irpex rosettiformis]